MKLTLNSDRSNVTSYQRLFLPLSHVTFFAFKVTAGLVTPGGSGGGTEGVATVIASPQPTQEQAVTVKSSHVRRRKKVCNTEEGTSLPLVSSRK